jgi:hypothetical protein
MLIKMTQGKAKNKMLLAVHMMLNTKSRTHGSNREVDNDAGTSCSSFDDGKEATACFS